MDQCNSTTVKGHIADTLNRFYNGPPNQLIEELESIVLAAIYNERITRSNCHE